MKKYTIGEMVMMDELVLSEEYAARLNELEGEEKALMQAVVDVVTRAKKPITEDSVITVWALEEAIARSTGVRDQVLKGERAGKFTGKLGTTDVLNISKYIWFERVGDAK
jgi:hypothetical protein